MNEELRNEEVEVVETNKISGKTLLSIGVLVAGLAYVGYTKVLKKKKVEEAVVVVDDVEMVDEDSDSEE